MNFLATISEMSPIDLPPITDRPIRLAVLISGGGTTLLNFHQCMTDGSLNAEIPIVVSSQSDCLGVTRARGAGLKCSAVVRSEFNSVSSFSQAVFDQVRPYEVDYVVLAGFLCLVEIPDDFAFRVLNIHPSLIPAFCGKGMYGHHVHEAVVKRGAKISGCTVHFADNEYDHGPIVLQSYAAIPDESTSEEVARLVFDLEKIAYPEAIRRIASGRMSIVDGRTIFQP